jgi:hypothetical protein
VYAGDSLLGHVYMTIYTGKENPSCVYEALYMTATTLDHVQVHEHFFLGIFKSRERLFLCRMVLEWREREHEEIDEMVERNVGAQKDLKRCGICKFWLSKE